MPSAGPENPDVYWVWLRRVDNIILARAVFRHNATLFRRAGYDRDGYDVDGRDRYGRPDERSIYNNGGYNARGYNRSGCDRRGYNRFGFKNGFNRDGYNTQGTRFAIMEIVGLLCKLLVYSKTCNYANCWSKMCAIMQIIGLQLHHYANCRLAAPSLCEL